METTVMQLSPSPARVMRQQFSVLAAPGTIATLAIGLGGVQLLGAAGWGVPHRFERLPAFDVFPFLVIIGALWPAVVWQGEGPSRRLYHWSLPVPRVHHDLLRVAAGGAWLLLGLVAVGAFQIAVSFGAGYSERIADVSLGSWLNFVTGPITMYLVVSALAVLTDHPIRWLLGIMFGTMAAGVACNVSVACSSTWVLAAFRHFFGLTDAIAPYIVKEMFNNPGVAAGFGALVNTALGLAAGCTAVYVAARIRSR